MQIRMEEDWNGSLEQEVTKILQNEIAPSVIDALYKTIEDSRLILHNVVDKEVYRKYNPKVYPRRSENKSLGIPLDDIGERNASTWTEMANTATLDGRATIDYHPTGQHKYIKYSSRFGSFTRDGETIHNVDGDALIGRIENKTPPYNWDSPKLRERQFWQKFVQQMIEGGRFARDMRFFMKGKFGRDYKETRNDVIREPEDGDY